MDNMDVTVAKAGQRESLYLDIYDQTQTEISSTRKSITSQFDIQTIDFSNAIYGWGSSVYHGISGKVAKSASSALNRLSTINGLDDGVLSIKVQSNG